MAKKTNDPAGGTAGPQSGHGSKTGTHATGTGAGTHATGTGAHAGKNAGTAGAHATGTGATAQGHPGRKQGPIPKNLFARMERSHLGTLLGGVQFRTGTAGAVEVMSQDPAAVNQISFGLGRIAYKGLPLGVLDPVRRGNLAKTISPVVMTLGFRVATALRLAAASGVPFQVQPEGIEDLMGKRGLYATYRLTGTDVSDMSMDQNEVTGALLIYLIDDTVKTLNGIFTDPKAPQTEKDKLMQHFGPALAELDEVLSRPQNQKEALAAKRGSLAQLAAETAADAQMEDVAMRLREQLVVPREALFAAARRYAQKQPAQGSAVLADQPQVLVGGSLGMPRRIG